MNVKILGFSVLAIGMIAWLDAAEEGKLDRSRSAHDDRGVQSVIATQTNPYPGRREKLADAVAVSSPAEAPAPEQAAPAPAAPVVVDGDAAMEAAEKLKQYLAAMKINLGWDKEYQRLTQVGTYDIAVPDPKGKPTKFFLKREMAARIAMLMAKAEIIETFNTKMSAEERFEQGVDAVIASSEDLQRDYANLQGHAQRCIDDMADTLSEIGSVEAVEEGRDLLHYKDRQFSEMSDGIGKGELVLVRAALAKAGDEAAAAAEKARLLGEEAAKAKHAGKAEEAKGLAGKAKAMGDEAKALAGSLPDWEKALKGEEGDDDQDKQNNRNRIAELRGKNVTFFKDKRPKVASTLSRVAQLQGQAMAFTNKVPAQKFSSKVKTAASMPLFGATVIAQAESWKDGNYQMAVAMVWSRKLEDAARVIVTGDVAKLESKGKQSLAEWVRSSDFSTMCGSRQFLDNEGRRYFIGIGTREIPAKSVEKADARLAAQLTAKTNAVYSVFADVEAQKTASMKGEVSKEDSSTISESVGQILGQSIKDRTVNGLTQVHSFEAMHPIAQTRVYGFVYAIDPDSAGAALKTYESQYATRLQDVRRQAVLAGRSEGLKQAVAEEQANQAVRLAAAAAAKEEVKEEVSQREAAIEARKAAAAERPATQDQGASQSKAAPRPSPKPAAPAGGPAREGSYIGGGAGAVFNDDF